jgi:GDP-L-fucose synthase
MNKDHTIFVAGHRGMVGSAILRRLEGDGFTRLVTRTRQQLDLTDQQAVRSFFHSRPIDHVVLAAARVGGIFANSIYPAEFIHQNLAITVNVVHEAFGAGVRRLLFLGSSCIYPKHADQPLKEDRLLSGSLEPTNEPYAVAKIAGIKLCQAYNRQYGTGYLSVMPTNLYGPRDNFDLETSHVLPAMIRKCHLARLAQAGDWGGITADEQRLGPIPEDVMACLAGIGESTGFPCPDAGRVANPALKVPGLRLWGSGKPRREFLHVEDMADACLFVMGLDPEAIGPGTFFNVGCGRDLPIAELARQVAGIVGFSGKIFWDRDKPDGTPRKLLDISGLQTLGWRPRISLEDGIRRVYRRYLDDAAGQSPD